MYKGYQFDLFKSQWGINPGFKGLVDKLNELIPLQGKIEFSRSKNKDLETFRKAQNAVYDLFNNGLCNRRSEFIRLFGFSPLNSKYWNEISLDDLENTVERSFTRIIVLAAKEQGIV